MDHFAKIRKLMEIRVKLVIKHVHSVLVLVQQIALIDVLLRIRQPQIHLSFHLEPARNLCVMVGVELYSDPVRLTWIGLNVWNAHRTRLKSN